MARTNTLLAESPSPSCKRSPYTHAERVAVLFDLGEAVESVPDLGIDETAFERTFQRFRSCLHLRSCWFA